MTEKDWIKSLDHETPPPQIDITDKVLRTIRLTSTSSVESRFCESEQPSLALPALLATLAGSTVALVAFQLVTTMQDPFNSFLDTFKLVLQ